MSATFREWWRSHIYPNRHAWDEVYRRKLLTFLNDESDAYRLLVNLVEARRCSDDAKVLVARTLADTISSRHWIYCASHAVGEGLKVFEPTPVQCEALENVDPRFPPADYRQPFPTFCIAFPPDYRDRRVVVGHSIWSTIEEEQYPLGIIAHHETGEWLLAFTVLLSNGSILTNVLDLRRKVETIDELIEETRYDLDQESQMEILNKNEQELLYRTTRLAVNACSLLVHLGYEKSPESPADRRERNRLKHAMRHGRGEAQAQAAVEMKFHPICYGFNQNVRLFDRETLGNGNGGAPGVGKSPHWRSGTWVNQPHGEGRALRKRIFRKPVLVNEHLLKAPTSQTSATYKKG